MFAKRPKHEERAAARRLRTEGRSLREISRELGVALSSVSVWTRDLQPRLETNAPAPPVRWEPAQLCNGCGRILVASDFHKGQSRCKECRREYIRQRGELHRSQTRRARDKRRAAARAYIIDLLRSGACADCGLEDPAVLEFDHVGPKRMEVGKLVGRRTGWNTSRLRSRIASSSARTATVVARLDARGRGVSMQSGELRSAPAHYGDAISSSFSSTFG
jgi:transposase-like protein